MKDRTRLNRMKDRIQLNRIRVIIILFVMVALIHNKGIVSVFAEEVSETATATAGSGDRLSEAVTGNNTVSVPVSFFDEKKLGEVQQIHVPFPNVTHEKLEWDFPYSDGFFSIPSEEFSITMARGSMGLTVSAFRSSGDEVSLQYETYLRGAGFTNIYSFGYDKPPVADSLSGVIGMKHIDDCTVIAAAACGHGYGNEWASNFKVGNGEIHEGFSQAAGLFEEHLNQYLKDNGIEGKKKLWVSGFSRASAVCNILAAEMIESGEFDDVYAYLFGVPRTTTKPVRYKGIFNICGQYDPVPSVPLQSWGYQRYGTDLFTPAQESDSDYTELARSTDAVGLKLDGKSFRNNPEVNYLFVIDRVRVICASFTVLSIFLLSLRGTLRYRRKNSIILTSFLFFCFAITFLFFDRTKKLPFSCVSVNAFAFVIGLYTVAAVRTFREPSEDESYLKSGDGSH